MPFKPIYLQNDLFQIHPLREMDIMRQDDIELELFDILSDIETTKFISEKRVSDKKAVNDLLFGVILGYHKELSYGHLISNRILNRVIGFINIISPERVKQCYTMKEYVWMVEYYIHKLYWGRGIMSEMINVICQRMNQQGIKKVGAVCDKENVGSIRVLEKAGFSCKYPLDAKQDYYELIFNNEQTNWDDI